MQGAVGGRGEGDSHRSIIRGASNAERDHPVPVLSARKVPEEFRLPART